MKDLRKSYQKGTLEMDQLNHDPLQQFLQWFNDALDAELTEPNAMTLSTVDASGQPSARIVLLKGVTDDGFEFYTNYNSQKGTHLASNPKVAITFLWKELERQVRIEGVAEKVSKEKSQAYFQSRPRGSQIGAMASPQSEVITDRSILDENVDRITGELENTYPIPCPDYWGGYVVLPQMIEFWQGRQNRMHDRFRYRKEGDEWKIERLAP